MSWVGIAIVVWLLLLIVEAIARLLGAARKAATMRRHTAVVFLICMVVASVAEVALGAWLTLVILGAAA